MLYKDIIDGARDVALKRDDGKRKAFVNSVAGYIKSLPIIDIDNILKAFEYARKKGVIDLVVANISDDGNNGFDRFAKDVFLVKYRNRFVRYGIGKNYVYFPIHNLYADNDLRGDAANNMRYDIVIYKKTVYICIDFDPGLGETVSLDMVKVLVQNKQTLINFAKSDTTPIIFKFGEANKFADIAELPKLVPERFLECVNYVKDTRIGQFVYELNSAFEALG